VLLVELRPDRGPDWVSVLESHHRSWAFSRNVPAAETSPVSHLASGLMALNLAYARLMLAGSELIAYRDTTLYRVGYEGTRGCRLSVFVLPHGLRVTEAAFNPPMQVHMWHLSDQDLLVLAEGMEDERFRELALAIERAVREERPFDPDTRQRLAKGREGSRPCRA
jgi:hypothetical protein